MGQIRDAALIGALVGVLHGIVNAVEFQYLLLPTMIPIMMSQISQQNPNASAMLPVLSSLLVPMILFFAVIFSVVLGVALAIVFVSVRNTIPGSSTLRKAFVFSIILLALEIILGLGSFSIATYGSTAISVDIISVVEFPLLGLLFGYLFEMKTKIA